MIIFIKEYTEAGDIMIYINNTNTDPYFNLAAEEYILKNFDDECFMLWRNNPAIIIGKNQNALSEINLDYVKNNNIPVVRRMTGGGAVYHDLGNLNFTFISYNADRNFNDFKKFTKPIIDVLIDLGVNAEFSGRNDLIIDGRKFSGNAQCRYRDKVLHHGTLLFSSNMGDISSSLNAGALKFKDKSVKSVSSRVTNICEHLKTKLSIDEFKNLIRNHILNSTKDVVNYELDRNDLDNIEKLADDKYKTWEWNFGNSPEYNFHCEKKFRGGTVEVYLDVKDGIINNARIYGDFFSQNNIKDIENALKGIKHKECDIKDMLHDYDIESYFSNISSDELLKCFF